MTGWDIFGFTFIAIIVLIVVGSLILERSGSDDS